MFFAAEIPDLIARSVILSVFGLAWVVSVVRVVGLRAFSKMTAFDFVVTVATGSLLAGAIQATSWSSFMQPLLAMAGLLGAQYIVAKLRLRSEAFQEAVQNNPVLLMLDGEVDQKAMDETRVSMGDLMGKLREANVLDLSKVRAVVLETTGDISVLHGDQLDPVLLNEVRRISLDGKPS